jgi:hypothetical protein
MKICSNHLPIINVNIQVRLVSTLSNLLRIQKYTRLQIYYFSNASEKYGWKRDRRSNRIISIACVLRKTKTVPQHLVWLILHDRVGETGYRLRICTRRYLIIGPTHLPPSNLSGYQQQFFLKYFWNRMF